MLSIFDSVTISEIPASAEAVAGYVGGAFPTFSSLVADFPHAHHLSIAVNSAEDAECLDIERGDAVPSDGPAWFKRQRARGVVRPCFYADASTMPSVISTLEQAGIPRSEFRVWTAHFTDTPHLEAGADATQWTDRALGRNLDQSLAVEDFFTDPKPPPVVNPQHYDWFPTGPFPSKWGSLNERKVVEQYDGARKHPVRYVLYLKLVLRPRLQFLADRVAHEALTQKVNGRPSWGQFRRGWRFQQLVHRAQGQRFVA